MSNKTYDTLKLIALLIAPIASFIGQLLEIWEVPLASQVGLTFTALDTLFGAIVVIAKKIYDVRKDKAEDE